MTESGFCTVCGFHVDNFEGYTRCPECGATGIPCSDDNNVTVKVNIHELQILAMWSEHYANQHKDKSPEMIQCVYGIASRLQQQLPEKTALTLAGEVRELQDYFGFDKIRTNISGVEALPLENEL